MNTNTGMLTCDNLNTLEVRMLDRKDVREINRATAFPRKPHNWDYVHMKHKCGIELTKEEEDYWYAYMVQCGRHDQILVDDSLHTLLTLGVQGRISLDEELHNWENETSRYPLTMREQMNKTNVVRREAHPYLELVRNECRDNAMRVCLAPGSNYKYMEGVMIPNGFGAPITHAWNVDADGNQFDFTLHESVTGQDTYASGSGLYLGIEIPIDIVQRVWTLTKRTPPIIPFLDIRKKMD